MPDSFHFTAARSLARAGVRRRVARSVKEQTTTSEFAASVRRRRVRDRNVRRVSPLRESQGATRAVHHGRDALHASDDGVCSSRSRLLWVVVPWTGGSVARYVVLGGFAAAGACGARLDKWRRRRALRRDRDLAASTRSRTPPRRSINGSSTESSRRSRRSSSPRPAPCSAPLQNGVVHVYAAMMVVGLARDRLVLRRAARGCVRRGEGRRLLVSTGEAGGYSATDTGGSSASRTRSSGKKTGTKRRRSTRQPSHGLQARVIDQLDVEARALRSGGRSMDVDPCRTRREGPNRTLP